MSTAFTVRGRVQGVGFRAGVERLARRHGLDGWVRNHGDGSVQGCVSGEPAAVEAFLADLPHASPHGRVDALTHGPGPATVPPGFEVLPSVPAGSSGP